LGHPETARGIMRMAGPVKQRRFDAGHQAGASPIQAACICLAASRSAGELRKPRPQRSRVPQNLPDRCLAPRPGARCYRPPGTGKSMPASRVDLPAPIDLSTVQLTGCAWAKVDPHQRLPCGQVRYMRVPAGALAAFSLAQDSSRTCAGPAPWRAPDQVRLCCFWLRGFGVLHFTWPEAPVIRYQAPECGLFAFHAREQSTEIGDGWLAQAVVLDTGTDRGEVDCRRAQEAEQAALRGRG